MFRRLKSKLSSSETPPPPSKEAQTPEPAAVEKEAQTPEPAAVKNTTRLSSLSLSSFTTLRRKSGTAASGVGARLSSGFGIAKRGVGAGLGIAKRSMISASDKINAVTKDALETRLAKEDEKTRKYMLLKQINVFRRQGHGAFHYTMELPENLTRDAVIGNLMFNGGPPPSVSRWILGHGDANQKAKNSFANKWLCSALDAAHISGGIKNAAVELLSVKQFTNNLSTMGLFIPLKLHCEKSLLKIGSRLDTFYVANDLYLKLGTVTLDMHPAAVANTNTCINTNNEESKADTNTDTTDIRDITCDVIPLRRQDHPAVGLAPMQEHSETWEYFDEESIYIHILRLTARAIDTSYQHIMEEIALESTNGDPKDYTFSKATIKGDSRIRSKALSQDDHCFENRPRPALNIDVNRNCMTFDTPEELLAAAKAICAHASFGGGAARVKNGFELSSEQAKDAYHYRTLMLNMLYDVGLTFGELAAQENVIQMWNDYVEASPENPNQAWGTWRKQAQAAVTHLRSDFMSDKPVKLIVESQLLLKEYKLGRDEMHLLYKVVRSDSDKALFQQFAGAGKNKIPVAKVGSVTWQSEEAKTLLALQAKLTVINGEAILAAEVLRWACTVGRKSIVDTLLLHMEQKVVDANYVNLTGRVERDDDVEGAKMAIQSHTMKLYPLFLGQPNGGYCFKCNRIGINRCCRDCHLCSSCCSEEYCTPCAGQPCRWCSGEEGTCTFPEHECCNLSNIQRCFTKTQLLKKQKKKQNETAEQGEVKEQNDMKKKKSRTSWFKKKILETSQSKEDRTKTALFLASEEGHFGVVESLLRNKSKTAETIDVNKPAHGLTSLAVASSKGHETIVRLLLAHPNIDVNYQPDASDLVELRSLSGSFLELCGMTALAAACFVGHEGVVHLLLQHESVDVNTLNHYHEHTKSALAIACERGHIGVVNLLLQHQHAHSNIDLVDFITNGDIPPLFAASTAGNVTLCNILLKHILPTSPGFVNVPASTNNMTSLIAACVHGHEEVAAILLALPNIDVFAQCTKLHHGKQLTALIAASKIGNVPIVKNILATEHDHGKLLAAKDYKGRNAWRASIHAGRKRYIPFVQATAIRSKGSKPDRQEVERLLRDAAKKTKNCERLLKSAEEEEEAAGKMQKQEMEEEAIRERMEKERVAQGMKEEEEEMNVEMENLAELMEQKEKEEEEKEGTN
jgi:ankyrin repeat protein